MNCAVKQKPNSIAPAFSISILRTAIGHAAAPVNPVEDFERVKADGIHPWVGAECAQKKMFYAQ